MLLDSSLQVTVPPVLTTSLWTYQSRYFYSHLSDKSIHVEWSQPESGGWGLSRFQWTEPRDASWSTLVIP